jgi:hypothetical protein
MASTHKSLRSGTANKRPTTSIADGQIALNTNAASPGLYFKDSTGASIIKIGPVHVGTTAPNVAPAGSSGNSNGETWLDTSLTPNGWKVWTGAAWVNATPAGSATVQGLLELATDAETQAGSDTARAVTPAGLQSKVSDSTSTTSSTTIASSTAVKSAYDLANAALPKSGGTVTGNLEIGTSGSLTFEGATADAFETTLAVVDPTADRTITFPDTTGTVVTTGDTGTVTSAMIANGTIVDADVSASAEIAVSKLADGAARQLLQTDAAGTGVEWTTNVDVPGTLDVTGTTTLDSTLSVPLGSAAAPTVFFTGDSNTGIYSPGADQLAISTNGTGRVFVDSSGRVLVGVSSTSGLQTGARHVFNDGSGSAFTGVSVGNPGGGLNNTDLNITAWSGSGANYFTSKFRQIGDGSLTFHTQASSSADGAGTTTERLRITSSGAVGVGTSSPSKKFEVANGDLRLSDGYTISWGDDAWRIFRNGSQLRFDANGTQALTIDSSQRVGIGTTTPSEALTVNGRVQSQWNAFVNGGTTSYSGDATSLVTGSTAGMWAARSDSALLFSIGSNEKARIDSSGRLGIGSTSPSRQLSLGDTNPTATFRSTTTTGQCTLFFGDSDSDARGAVTYENNGDALGFWSAGGEKARIDSSGRLLVGTSTARANFYNSTVSAGFQLEGAGATNRIASIISSDNGGAGTGSVLLLGRQNSNAVGGNTLVSSGDAIGYVSYQGSDGTEFVEAANIKAEVDGTPGANDMPGRLVFSTTADGSASPTERMRITQNGYFKASNNGSYVSTTAAYHEFTQDGTFETAYFRSSNASPVGIIIYYSAASPNGTSNYFLTCYDSGSTLRAGIRSNGGLANYSANNANLSDINAKKDISLAADTWNCLKEWEIVNYRYKDQPDDADLNLGVIAQQVAESCPEVITIFQEAKEATETEPAQEERLGVKEQQMYWMAIKALQEAQARIESLEADVAQLKGA